MHRLEYGGQLPCHQVSGNLLDFAIKIAKVSLPRVDRKGWVCPVSFFKARKEQGEENSRLCFWGSCPGEADRARRSGNECSTSRAQPGLIPEGMKARIENVGLAKMLQLPVVLLSFSEKYLPPPPAVGGHFSQIQQDFCRLLSIRLGRLAQK